MFITKKLPLDKALTMALKNGIRLAMAAGIGISIGISCPVWAHHSFASFDLTKTVEVNGEVKEWRWTNPHSWLVVATRDAAGVTQEMNLEANGPGYLVRQGWKRESLKPGDAITVVLNPMRDGSLGGNLVKVTFPDGRSLSASPGRLPTPPQGEQK